jgi:hypothetical protein
MPYGIKQIVHHSIKLKTMTKELPEFPPKYKKPIPENTQIRDGLLIIFLVIAGVVLVIIASYIVKFAGQAISSDSSDWSALGGYVGGLVGPLFSLLAAVLIYKTFQAQKRNSDLQQFESTFFSLLATQRDIAKSLRGLGEIEHSEHTVLDVGYVYLQAASEQLEKKLRRQLYGIEPASIPKLKPEELSKIRQIVWPQVREAYQQMYKGRESQLDHYFRHLYHIVKYTKQSYIDESSKREYVDIVQAQMSDDELFLAFYNGIGEHGYPKFYELMEEYQFIENMRDRGDEQLTNLIKLHRRLFYPETFPPDSPE